MADLKLENLNKSYGAVHTIHDVSLAVDDGEFVVFVGPSGCGKSTLLRMIAGLEEISAGSLSIGGRDVTKVDPAERQIAMVFQSYALYPHMTVRGNLGFALRMTGHSKQDVSAKVESVARMLRLTELMHRKPGQLSGGQRQRVAIGRALVRSPRVFLFDEPLSNLDAELRVQMRIELAQLHERIGITTIYVTHDQVEAMTLADRIVVLRGGRVEQIGTPMELYDQPANQFVAGFIGSPAMNFLAGRALSSANGVARVALELGPIVDCRVRKTLSEGEQLVLGIRPEHIVLGHLSGAASHTGIATLVELLGSDSFIHLTHGSHSITIRDSQGGRARSGDQVTLSFPPGACHLFDASGARVSDASDWRAAASPDKEP